MDSSQEHYWPFDLPIREAPTELDRRIKAFLDTAYAAGYKPYVLGFGFENFGASYGRKQRGQVTF